MTIIPVSTQKHINIVESLARDIWTEYYTPIIGKAQVVYMLDKFQSREAIARQIADGFRYYLILQDDRHIGYAGIEPKGDELFLSKIYIAAAERGRGYGRTCSEFIDKIAQEEGFDAVTLTVNKNNMASIAAYERWGFKKLFPLVQDIGGGFVMDDYKMGKTISR
ncbi:MAG: GNAT family N-acetyltransferase [Deltaproteobacteria bacterium]|nr:GNAT family N-acetyltransferase [Deltaproteobacteria bacterium]